MKHLTVEDICTAVQKYNPKGDLELIRRAYAFAEEAHGDQMRKSGERYTQHLLHVANILADLRLNTTTIAAGILHDVIEDTPVTAAKLRKEFGKDITQLVQGLTKISKIDFKSQDEETAENVRKVILATSKDIRVILVKLSDRMHNMRTLQHLNSEKQQRIARETREIYAPIAHKLGIYMIKSELEDLAFKFLEPDEYQEIKKKIGEKKSSREARIKQILDDVKALLKKHKIPAKVSGRSKSFWSIYNKINKREYRFEDIKDLLAFRIIVRNTEDCYKVMYLIHETWKPLMPFFADYIANPKPNGYQSIHTKFLVEGTIAEMQIRSLRMHQEAEAGIAAHWRYKKTERDKKFDQKISWLKQILEWKEGLPKATAEDFIEHLRVELFKGEIIVFTPKGEPITLPEDACPVDFAYMVHSNIGDHCARVKVNGELKPLDIRLQSGDMVEVITQNSAKPSRQWLQWVRTPSARSKIRKALGIEITHRKAGASTGGTAPNIMKQLRIDTDAQVRISRCCSLEYGDPVSAFLTKDGKASVHHAKCPNVATLMGNKEIPTKWIGEAPMSEVQVVLTVDDQVGVAALVLSVISSKDMNITTINGDPRKDRYIMYVGLQMKDPTQLDGLLKELRDLKPVQYVSVQ
ncbi:MAG: RelA/SpoT family protein [Candidatus Nanoarchaeia archaeon]